MRMWKRRRRKEYKIDGAKERKKEGDNKNERRR